MHTQLCHFLQARRHQHPYPRRPKINFTHKNNASKGQVLVIFGFALIALIAFVGLAMDAASLYLTHARLKRAVDAAAVSAANDIKQGQQVEELTEAAKEILMLHNVVMDDPDIPVQLHVYDCTSPNIATLAPDFAAVCPGPGYDARKLVYVEATQGAPLYFMQLIGFNQVPLTTYSISEAAPVDLVIVIDTSESMGLGSPGYINQNFDPTTCNAATVEAEMCEPLLSAKKAAKALVESLYEGYDQVAIVTYDTEATAHNIYRMDGQQSNLSDNLARMDPLATPARNNDVLTVIDNIQLHNDPRVSDIWSNWYYRGNNTGTFFGGQVFNPIFPDDRDGDGLDEDYPDCATEWWHKYCCTLDDDRWDDSKDPYGWGGVPCDDDNKLDAFDFDEDDVYTEADTTEANKWLAENGSFSINSTCTGCGIRVASNILRDQGRPSSVWVIVLLSDGVANMTDTPAINDTYEVIPTVYPNGFCVDKLDDDHASDDTWQQPYCMDVDISDRYCIDTVDTTCPPGTTHTAANPDENYYTVYDWTLDMVDEAALTTTSGNDHEPRGNDIALYVIGLGDVTHEYYSEQPGVTLLRYMAAVGDDGDRSTDPCVDDLGNPVAGTKSCGQYYYAPVGGALTAIFEDIAGRIYTRITN